MSGTYENRDDTGMAQTVQQVQHGLAATQAALAEQQAQSARFMRENGADVIGGHSPVNPAPSTIMAQGGGEVYDAGS